MGKEHGKRAVVVWSIPQVDDLLASSLTKRVSSERPLPVAVTDKQSLFRLELIPPGVAPSCVCRLLWTGLPDDDASPAVAVFQASALSVCASYIRPVAALFRLVSRSRVRGEKRVAGVVSMAHGYKKMI